MIENKFQRTETTLNNYGSHQYIDSNIKYECLVASHLSSEEEETKTSTTEEPILSTRSSNQIIQRRRRRRYNSFFHSNLDDHSIEKENCDFLITEAKTQQMKEHKTNESTTRRIITPTSTSKECTSTNWHQQRQSPTSIEPEREEKSQKQITNYGDKDEDEITASTTQTTGMSTHQSGSDSSLPTHSTLSSSSFRSPSSNAMVIEANLSSLSELSSSNKDRTDIVVIERNDREVIGRSGTRNVNCSKDHLQSSMMRLYNLEIKRNSLRKQQFQLEQRLYNLCTSEGNSSMNDPNKKSNAFSSHERKVIDWKYIINDNGTIQFADGQIYEGPVRDGMRHGTGKNTWIDGQTYHGQWNNSSRNGWGTHSWKDGRTVTGTWKDGHLHGRVYFKWPNGAIFDGHAFNGKKEGRGISTFPDGTVYNGNFLRGKEHGFGTLALPNGTKYRGNFLHGIKSGHGVMFWKDRIYDGNWLEGKPYGQGRVVWSNGTVFTGKLQNGKFHGSGVYVWPSGKKFVGRWNIGAKTGHGFETWPSGKKYDGQYKNGCKEGYGTMTWGASTYCGGFKNNKRSGRGILTDDKGHVVHCGLWKDDRPCNDDESEKDAELISGAIPHAQTNMH